LINRDRAAAKCPPVELDQTACAAGQLHSDTMAAIHFNSHWHPDGTKPPQRYAECGGFDYDMENSHGTGDCPPFKITVAEKQLFTKKEIEQEESCYFDEKPPNDGHRRNILNPEHTHVGLGLTLIELKVTYDPDQPEDTNRQLVSAQEFINKRASKFVQSDTSLHKGRTYYLSGELNPGATFDSFQLAREPAAKPISLDVLKDRSQLQYHGGYNLPADQVLAAFPPPYLATPHAKATTDGRSFSCEITPQSDWRSGLYYITIWAKVDGAPGLQPISLHTIMLE
jgi:Cysteine-rich secretory protein family